MTLVEVLEYLRGPGINAALGILLSFIVEWFPKWDSLESKIKRIVMLLLCITVPIVATLGLVLIGAVAADDYNVWYAAFLAGATAFSGNQIAHLRKLV
jgi:hypothetical protein